MAVLTAYAVLTVAEGRSYATARVELELARYATEMTSWWVDIRPGLPGRAGRAGAACGQSRGFTRNP